MTSILVAVTDTCSIFPQTLRDVLLRAAEVGLYRLRWSEEILDELGRNLREERGLTQEQTQHLLTEMRRAFPEATVSGYERLVGRMTNHPGDRHVLAAAVQVAAQVIVTDNLRDFPDEALAPFNTEAKTPDEFLTYLFDRHPDEMAQIMIDLNAARRKPPETLLSSLDRLAKSAPRFVEQLREHPSIASRLGPVITAQLPLQVKETAKELSPTIQRILTSILTSPTMTLVHEISEELSPELEEELFDQARRRALALSDITEFRLETQPGQILHVAVIDAAQSPDFANLLRAHHGKATVIMASKWWIFANREYASLQIQTVAPVADTLELAFSGPSRLALALAINRQGRFSVTTSIPTSEADVLAAGLVWTFPFSQEAEASLNRMIQPTQGTVGAT